MTAPVSLCLVTILLLTFMVAPEFDQWHKSRRVINWLGVVSTGAIGPLTCVSAYNYAIDAAYWTAAYKAVGGACLTWLSFANCRYRTWRV